ncbi:MAG: hypothetical protein ABFD16_25865 [Thermoguttaceae bacterium]|jgi:outer membrane protein TolC
MRRTSLLLLCVLGASLLASVAVGDDSPGARRAEATAPDAAKQLQSLLEERRDTLRKLLKHVESQHASGNATEVAVIRASNQLIEAELELVRTKPERIALFEKIVDNLRRAEQWTEARYEAGRCTWEDALAAKAARLQGEINLVRERTRQP